LLFISIESGSKAGGGPTIIEGFASEKNCAMLLVDKLNRQFRMGIPSNTNVYRLTNGMLFIKKEKHEMTVKKYTKKPATIEAIEWTGDNFDDIVEFDENERACLRDRVYLRTGTLFIETLEGDMKATIGDYIIKGVDGELYPCKPEIFKKTYEECIVVEELASDDMFYSEGELWNNG